MASEPELLLEELRLEREDIFAQVQSIYDASRNLTIEGLGSFISKYNRLDELERSFEDTTRAIRRANVKIEDDKNRLNTATQLVSFKELVDGIRDKYRLVSKVSPALREGLEEVRLSDFSGSLPRIEIPAFDGKLEEWSNFISLFESLVHANTKLSNTTKFHYLRTSLKGEALSIVSCYPLEPQNYDLAYDMLKKRYQNTRRLAAMYVNKILDFKPLTNGSYQNLNSFLSAHECNMSAMLALGIDDLGDFLKFQISLRNLDPNTRRAFEESCTSGEIPTYLSLMQFVTERSRKLALMTSTAKVEIAPNSSGGKPFKPSKFYNGFNKDNRVFYVRDDENSKISPRINKSKGVVDASKSVYSDKPSLYSSSKHTAEAESTNYRCRKCSGPHLTRYCKSPVVNSEHETRSRKSFLYCYKCKKPDFTVVTCPACNPKSSGNGQGDL